LCEETVKIKDYVGKSYEEVRAELDELGFTVQSEIATSETVPEGSIIEQDIESGEEVVPSETTITFTVSSGRREISMIDLSGFSREEVDKYVDENGLYLSTSQEASDSVPVDQVIRQEPAEGDPLYAGD